MTSAPGNGSADPEAEDAGLRSYRRFLAVMGRISSAIAVVGIFAMLWISQSAWPFAGFCLGVLYSVWMFVLEERRRGR